MSDASNMPDYRGCRVLVTGAGGFIGRWVARALGEGGAELTLAARDPERLSREAGCWEIRGRIERCELTSPGSLATLVFRIEPEVVFHLGGYGVDPSERDDDVMRRVNDEAVGELLDAVAALPTGGGWSGRRVVHAGSAFEYGPLPGLVDEETEPRPANGYGRTKLDATRRIERAASQGLAAICARLATVYGAGEHEHRLLPSILRAAAEGEPLELTSGRQERDFVWVGDVTEGLLRLGALDTDCPSVVNLATGVLTPVRGFAEAAARAIGMPEEQLRFGALPHREDEVWQGPLSVRRLERLTGWRPSTAIEDGVRATRAFLTREEDPAS